MFVTADASGFAVGACLSQWKDDVERPIAFASRTLSPAERKYSASEREALAALWACEKWHFYLYGRPFTLVTDHQALTSLLSTGGSGHRPLRLHRWASRLYRYSFRVLYKPGKENVVADCLSRAYESDASAVTSPILPKMDQAWDEADVFAGVQTIFGSSGAPAITLAEIASATDSDELLQQVARFVVDGWPPSRHQVQPELRVFFDRRLELSLVRGCVVRGFTTVVPQSLRQPVLSLAHEGHPGVVRMKRLCRETPSGGQASTAMLSRWLRPAVLASFPGSRHIRSQDHYSRCRGRRAHGVVFPSILPASLSPHRITSASSSLLLTISQNGRRLLFAGL